MPNKETILIICAHSDDHVFGAGGTIKKYSSEGKHILTLVLSYGEKSHPWLKEKVTQQMRKTEALQAGKILGCQTRFFDLSEGHFLKEYQEKKLEKKLIKILKKYKPTKILAHSNEDPHPDHRATYQITQALLKKTRFKPDLYLFSVWNPFSFAKRYFPKMYVNISPYFKYKIRALKCYKSQRYNAIYPLIPTVFIRAIKNGLHIQGKYAERFYKVK